MNTITCKTPFRVSRFSAEAPEGLALDLQGSEISTGRLQFGLDPRHTSTGELDYETRSVKVGFCVKLDFPELATALEGLGFDESYSAPITGILDVEGEILPDHNLNGGLHGKCTIDPHPLFPNGGLQVEVLEGY